MMSHQEFHELAHSTVVGFLPRIPDRYVEGFEAELDGGEYALAVENLVLTLVNDQVPVTSAEWEKLHQLLAYLNTPAAVMDGLTAAPSTP